MLLLTNGKFQSTWLRNIYIAIFILVLHTSCTVTISSKQLTLNVMKDQMIILQQRVAKLQTVICRENDTLTLLEKPQVLLINRQYRDCEEIFDEGHRESGIYMIHIFHGYYSIPIFCDMNTVGEFSGRRGWMLIQKRIDGGLSFDRGWNDYLEGFGSPDKEHWIGLRNILHITEQRKIGKYDNENLRIRIDVEDYDGITGYMEHSSFSLLSEDFDFAIRSLGKYSGTVGLGGPLEFSLSSPFSTYDHNKDRLRDEACVKTQRGGWWFGFCNHINLNGIYSKINEKMAKDKIFIRNWRAVNTKYTAFRYVSMKLQ